MDWSESLQNAIDYIEEHITEKIDYEEVAMRAYSSNFHFQRVFGIMCGFTLGEYIRRRKLIFKRLFTNRLCKINSA